MVVLFPRRIKRCIGQASEAKKLFLGLTSLTLSGMPPFLSLLSDVVFRPYTDNHHCYYHHCRIVFDGTQKAVCDLGISCLSQFTTQFAP